MFTLIFWQATAERAVKSFAQALAATLGAGGLAFQDVDWVLALSVAGMTALLSVLSFTDAATVALASRVVSLLTELATAAVVLAAAGAIRRHGKLSPTAARSRRDWRWRCRLITLPLPDASTIRATIRLLTKCSVAIWKNCGQTVLSILMRSSQIIRTSGRRSLPISKLTFSSTRTFVRRQNPSGLLAITRCVVR